MRVLLLILIVLVVAWFVTTHTNFSWQQIPLPVGLVLPPMSSCGLTVNIPLPGSSVSYQIPVSGYISHAQRASLGCDWATFEGQGGTAEVRTSTGVIVAGPMPIAVTDWTATTTPFSVQLDILSADAGSALPDNSRLTIHLEPENPSGRPSTTHLDIPVTLRR